VCDSNLEGDIGLFPQGSPGDSADHTAGVGDLDCVLGGGPGPVSSCFPCTQAWWISVASELAHFPQPQINKRKES
jgi:hypothetical protein